MSTDDNAIIEMTDGAWQSRAEPEVLAPINFTPEQDPPSWTDGQSYVNRPRPPAFTKSNRMQRRVIKHGALEVGPAWCYVKKEDVPPDALMLYNPTGLGDVRVLYVQAWLRNPNTGELKLLGDCLPVQLTTERNGVIAEHHFLDWQRMMGVPEHKLVAHMGTMTGVGAASVKHRPARSTRRLIVMDKPALSEGE